MGVTRNYIQILVGSGNSHLMEFALISYYIIRILQCLEYCNMRTSLEKTFFRDKARGMPTLNSAIFHLFSICFLARLS